MGRTGEVLTRALWLSNPGKGYDRSFSGATLAGALRSLEKHILFELLHIFCLVEGDGGREHFLYWKTVWVRFQGQFLDGFAVVSF